MLRTHLPRTHMSRTRLALITSALALTLSGCVTTPSPLQGEFSALRPTEAAKNNAVGETVRWGGRVVSVENFSNHSCFKILSVRMDSGSRPQREDQSDGRFIACRGGFYDPEVFKAGREVTITGRIDAIQTGRIGQMDYHYPRLTAEVIYLWPERRDVDVIVERSPYHYW